MMAWDKLTMFAIYALSSLTLSLLFFAVHYFVDKSIVHKANIWRAELLLVTRIGGFTFLWYIRATMYFVMRNLNMHSFVCGRYSISVTFTMFNKWFLTTWEGGFSFSALYTGGHMCYKFIFSRLWQCQTGTVVEPFSWYLFLVMVFPIGVTTAIDIMFSNLSLQYITITLYTITKTSVIAWTFMWALILKMEVFKLKTFVVVCFICLGISLAVASPTAISFTGVSYCLVASAAGGLRWAFTERLVRSNEQCKSPFVCLHHIAPVSATFMLPVGLVVDGVPFLNSQFAHDNNLAMLSFGILTCGGIMAFALILVEVKLVQLTSSVTMGVLGQLKELLQIIVAIIIFKDQVSSMNAMGLALALLMVGVYKWIKRGENLENFKAQLLSGQEVRFFLSMLSLIYLILTIT